MARSIDNQFKEEKIRRLVDSMTNIEDLRKACHFLHSRCITLEGIVGNLIIGDIPGFKAQQQDLLERPVWPGRE